MDPHHRRTLQTLSLRGIIKMLVQIRDLVGSTSYQHPTFPVSSRKRVTLSPRSPLNKQKNRDGIALVNSLPEIVEREIRNFKRSENCRELLMI